MPRKGTKPSYQQIALHLVANSIAPNEISTATQSAEFTSLETMMQEIEEITQREFHSSAIKQRFQRLLTSTKQLLESAKKARALKIDKDQTGYAEEIKQTAALAEAFDKELRSFAEHRDFRVQLGFFGTSILIAVGVALETMKQIDSQLMMRNYEGFLKS